MFKQQTIAQDICRDGSAETLFQCQNFYVNFWCKSTQYEADKLLVMVIDRFRLVEALDGTGLSFSLSTKNLIVKNDMKKGLRGGGVGFNRYYY